MTVGWIAGMVAAGESETLEFKSTTGTRREAARTVCAMLNQQGGRVLFGVNRVQEEISLDEIERIHM